jgi:hypothetical protein
MKNQFAVIKKLLGKGEQSARSYAGYIGVWDNERPCWCWTDGFVLIGQGDYVVNQPGYIINSKHVKLSEIKGYTPLAKHDDVFEPAGRYPNIGREITEIKADQTITVNADSLLRAVESLRNLSKGSRERITMEITEDRIKLKTGESWAIVCTTIKD